MQRTRGDVWYKRREGVSDLDRLPAFTVLLLLPCSECLQLQTELCWGEILEHFFTAAFSQIYLSYNLFQFQKNYFRMREIILATLIAVQHKLLCLLLLPFEHEGILQQCTNNATVNCKFVQNTRTKIGVQKIVVIIFLLQCFLIYFQGFKN